MRARRNHLAALGLAVLGLSLLAASVGFVVSSLRSPSDFDTSDWVEAEDPDELEGPTFAGSVSRSSPKHDGLEESQLVEGSVLVSRELLGSSATSAPSLHSGVLTKAATAGSALSTDTGAPSTALQVAVILDATLYASELVEGKVKGEWLERRFVETHVAVELESLEIALRAQAPLADVALGHTERSLVVDHGFGAIPPRLQHALSRIIGLPSERVSVDAVDEAIDAFKWKEGADKRILLIGGAGRLLTPGKTTLEAVMFRAEHHGIVVHVLEFGGPTRQPIPRSVRWASMPISLSSYFAVPSARQPWSEAAMAPMLADLRQFVARPTATLGRPPAHPRHGTLVSGGTYRLVNSPVSGVLDSMMQARDAGERYWMSIVTSSVAPDGVPERFRSVKPGGVLYGRYQQLELHAVILSAVQELFKPDPELVKLLAASYGPTRRTRESDSHPEDVLDDLAYGRVRPSEVNEEDLPPWLLDVDLEPLLDALWDFVDARSRIVETLRARNRAPDGTIQASGIGARMAMDLLAARRRVPSRR
ncbi:MAG: hypothetical protein HY791_03455 [Deltaproteobacteria bacterium]|nr:hypothetical protein [Deltaproteobacteria bacterium]